MNLEYTQIIESIVQNNKFKRLKNEKHHNGSRFDHSMSVAYRTYKICKRLHLDYKSATRAALLHDYFFDDEFKDVSKHKKLVKHYEKAIENAKNITFLTEKEEAIIASHMYPVGGKVPRSLEAVVVDFVDDGCSIKEEFIMHRVKIKNAFMIFMIILVDLVTR